VVRDIARLLRDTDRLPRQGLLPHLAAGRWLDPGVAGGGERVHGLVHLAEMDIMNQSAG
jgi:hypothetical protein